MTSVDSLSSGLRPLQDTCSKFTTSKSCCAATHAAVGVVSPLTSRLPVETGALECSWCFNPLHQSFCYKAENVAAAEYCQDVAVSGLDDFCESIFMNHELLLGVLALVGLVSMILISAFTAFGIRSTTRRSHSFQLAKARRLDHLLHYGRASNDRIRAHLSAQISEWRTSASADDMEMPPIKAPITMVVKGLDNPRANRYAKLDPSYPDSARAPHTSLDHESAAAMQEMIAKLNEEVNESNRNLMNVLTELEGLSHLEGGPMLDRSPVVSPATLPSEGGQSARVSAAQHESDIKELEARHQSAIADLQRKNEALLARKEKLSKKSLQQKEDIADYDALTDQLSEQSAGLEEIASKFMKEKLKWKGKISDLEAQVAELNGQRDRVDAQEADAQAADAQAERDALNEQLQKALQVAKAEAEATAKRESGETEALQKAMEELERKKAALDKLVADKEEVEASLAALNNAMQTLSEQHQSQHEDLLRENEDLKTRLKRAESSAAKTGAGGTDILNQLTIARDAEQEAKAALRAMKDRNIWLERIQRRMEEEN